MNDLQFIKPDWTVANNVKSLTTTRLGGFSHPPFDSLNLGLHVDDDIEKVSRNRKLLVEQLNLPNEPVWLNQTHSTNVIHLNESNIPHNKPYDGAITEEKGVVCAVMTADCLPLFLSNQDGTQVGVLHVGWRGLADGIIEKGVAMFSCLPENLITWAGPSISVSNFEIGLEVKEKLGGTEQAYTESNNKNKCYADMYELTKQRLSDCGVNNYRFSDYCTYNDDQLFYSYRREQITGRMVSLIWIR